MKPLRINFFGGPGAGKSTAAAWLFSKLKILNKPVELVHEYVKNWTYIPRIVNSWDQVYLFSKQQQQEFIYLKNGKNVITDSPLLLSTVYAKLYCPELELVEPLSQICATYNKQFPSLNFFLERTVQEYDPSGRYQSREQAIEIDTLVKELLKTQDNVYHVDCSDKKTILNLTLQYLQ